jgi:hypothetical protein
MEKPKNTKPSILLFAQHSNSAVVAIGYYGEVGHSNTPEHFFQAKPLGSVHS